MALLFNRERPLRISSWVRVGSALVVRRHEHQTKEENSGVSYTRDFSLSSLRLVALVELPVLVGIFWLDYGGLLEICIPPSHVVVLFQFLAYLQSTFHSE